MAAIPVVNACPLVPPSSAAKAVSKPVARGVAGTRVVPAAVSADAGEFKSRRKINGHIHGARQRVGVLPGMNGKGRVLVLRHEVAVSSWLLAISLSRREYWDGQQIHRMTISALECIKGVRLQPAERNLLLHRRRLLCRAHHREVARAGANGQLARSLAIRR